MRKTRLYIALVGSQPDEEAQEKAFHGVMFDEVIIEDAFLADCSPKAWNALIPHCASGDHLALYSLELLPLKPPALNKVLFDLLKSGVTIHLASPPLVIAPADNDPAFAMISAYETHRRSQLGRSVSQSLKASVRAGRPSRLSLAQLPEIQLMMRDPDLGTDDICRMLKVTRSTLYKFLAKHQASANAADEVAVAGI